MRTLTRLAATLACCCIICDLAPVSADDPSLQASPEVRVSTISGSGTAGVADGSAHKAQFIEPFGVVYDRSGKLYVSDAGAQRIRIVEKDGFAHTLAGSGEPIATGLWVEGGYQDGPGNTARFNRPAGLAVGSDGVLYVADTNNHCIRRVDADGNVTTYAGRPEAVGHLDGARNVATFDRPTGLALDASGTLYVADFSGIRAISPTGVVKTIPQFGNAPFGVAVANTDAGAVIFAADESGVLRRTPDGIVERYASMPASQKNVRDLQGEQPLGHPFALAAFDDHSIAFTDVRANTVRYLNWSAGSLQTLGGVPVENGAASGGGYRDGSGAQSRFDVPLGIAIRDSRSLVVADGGNKRIREIGGIDRTHDAVLGSTFPKSVSNGGYNIAFVGNSFLWQYTRWSDSIQGMVEQALASTTGTKARIRINPYVLPGSAFGADEQYIELLARGGAADFYVLNINPGNIYPSGDLAGTLQLSATASTWQPFVTSSLRKLRETVEGLHARILVVTTPLATDISPVETAWPELLSGDGQVAPNASVGTLLNDAVRASGVDLLDLWPAFVNDVKAPGHEPLFGSSDPHFSYHGRVVVARALSAWLKQHQPWRSNVVAQGAGISAPPASPSATPTASASPAPAVSYGYKYRPDVVASTDAHAPQIFEIDLNDQQLTAPGPLAVRVLTSINVNGVYAHISGKTIGVPPLVPGDFEASTNMPSMPSFLKGKSYTVQFEAITIDGRRTTADVRIFIKR
ncbi:MAG: hypothetical protein JO233_00220 [Candidatus Eremiobacteraeota bacterium]|nr:hypothetical protein [Candidatus Eremiobacteraeota bacterium]